MSDVFYSKDRRVYQFLAAAVDSSAIFGRFIGPLGKIGRVRGVEFLCTTQTTGSDSTISIGNNGATLPAQFAIPALAQFAGNVMTAAELALAGADEVAGTNDVELGADTVVECSSNGTLGAGDGDVTITVDWF